jgi:hypothetical protein
MHTVAALRTGLKIFALALLVAAWVNPKVEAGTSTRCRIYLIDRSQSVRSQEASPSALKPAEVIQSINFDMARMNPQDWIGIAAFGRTFAFQIPLRRRGAEMPVLSDLDVEVDPSESDLAGALQAVGLQMPEGVVREVVLFGDGRYPDPELAASTARALGLNLYVIGVGDPAPQDVRMLRVDPPAILRPGDTFAIDVELESTRSGPVTIHAGDRSESVQLVADRRAVVRIGGLVARPEQKSIVLKAVAGGFEDLYPENHQVQIDLRFEER